MSFASIERYRAARDKPVIRQRSSCAGSAVSHLLDPDKSFPPSSATRPVGTHRQALQRPAAASRSHVGHKTQMWVRWTQLGRKARLLTGPTEGKGSRRTGRVGDHEPRTWRLGAGILHASPIVLCPCLMVGRVTLVLHSPIGELAAAMPALPTPWTGEQATSTVTYTATVGP
jgi:hypothetical protein